MEDTPKKFFTQLAELYLKPDWTWNDFGKVQRLQADIITLHSVGICTSGPKPIAFADYELLNHMARYLIGDMREVLHRKDQENDKV